METHGSDRERKRVIAERFGMAEEGGERWDDVSEFRRALIERIVYLLECDAERLMAILYRVDVSEDAVTGVFRERVPENIAPALADLIIERQMRKVRTRRKDGSDG